MSSRETNSKPYSSISFKQQITFTAFSFITLSIIVSALGEIFVRSFSKQRFGKPDHIPPPYNTAIKDDYLGWKMTPGYSFTGKLNDLSGQSYDVDIRYDENGFKAFGDTASQRPKVLFLGDSFTASIEVSNERSFFNLVKDSLGVEVFAYGHAGFGTLQEYLVFDQWVDAIQPDLVVWEVCSNDFIDNYAPLEIVCGYKVGERRPYLGKDGGIFYRRPLSFWQKVKEHVYFYAWLERRWAGVKQNVFGIEPRVGEYYLSHQKRAYRPFDGAVEVTGEIFALIKRRLPTGTKVIVFQADTYQPHMDEFTRICGEIGFTFTAFPAQSVEAAANRPDKITVRSIDGCHWNEAGHRIVAQTLIPFIEAELGQ